MRVCVAILIFWLAAVTAGAQAPMPIAVPSPTTNFVLQILHTPATNTEPAVDFKISWGPASGFYTGAVIRASMGRTTFATVSNLDLYTDHYFVAEARDWKGRDSDYSTEAVYLAPADDAGLTNCISTFRWEIRKTNDFKTRQRFYRLFGSDDMKHWEPEPAIQTTTKTNW